MSLQDFEILEKLGAGSFGSVFKVRRRSDRMLYAMKRINISNLSKNEIADALTEVRILASVRHRNIARACRAELHT